MRYSVRQERRAAVMLESAIVLGVMLLTVLGALDLGLAVLRYNTLSEAARGLARHALVHGAQSPPELNAWGPASWAGAADESSEIAQAVKPFLVAMEPSKVSVRVEWPDGSNEPDERVQVTLTYEHQPIIPVVFGSQPITLTAVSTMRVAH
ncbi:MAG: pilus assembly protein [Planctomycetes bacterium]|nr:pilus assembly protein [Planctomycetota bacterium]